MLEQTEKEVTNLGLVQEQYSIGYSFWACALAFIKISICLFNRRLTAFISRKWALYHYTIIATIFIWVIIFVLGQLLACRPLWATGRLSDLGARDHNPTCIDTAMMNIAFSISHMALDFFILPVPLVVLKRIKLTLWQRLRLVFLFSVGLLSVLGAVMQVVSTLRAKTKNDLMCKYSDFIFNRIHCMPSIVEGCL